MEGERKRHRSDTSRAHFKATLKAFGGIILVFSMNIQTGVHDGEEEFLCDAK